MRRSEKEIRDVSTLEDIIDSAEVCRIGLAVDNVPYVVPVNFAYSGGCIYFHSAREGRKIDMIRANPRIAFEITSEYAIVGAPTACAWGTSYRCVMGTGLAVFVEAPDEKRRALNLIMSAYSGRDGWELDETALSRSLVIRIDIEEMTGKQSGGPRPGPNSGNSDKRTALP